MGKLVLGVFSHTTDADSAISELESNGYNPKDISIIMRDKQGIHKNKEGAKGVAEGILSGATAGGALGAVAGLLVANGIFPGLGVLLLGGPVASALGLSGLAATAVSGAVTGAAAGGVIGGLTGLGLSQEVAAEYEESIRQGGILVVVPARTGEDAEVRSILQQYNASQIRNVNTDETYEPLVSTTHTRRDEPIHSPAYFSEIRRRRPKDA